MSALWCLASSLSQQSDALVPSVPDTICRSYARISRRYLSATHPYRFSDRFVSILNCAIHLIPLATLTDLCYQKRAMPLNSVFHFYLAMSFPSLDGYDSLRTLDNEVVVTFVSCYLIVKSVLTCVSIQIQPLFSKCLVWLRLRQVLPHMDIIFVHTATTY